MLKPISQLISIVSEGAFDNHFKTIYGSPKENFQKKRYVHLLKQLEKDKGDVPSLIINSPGRTELGGNHTDHNLGCVLAAAVDLDCIAVVTPLKTPEVLLHSDDYASPIYVDLTKLQPQPEEQGRPEALIRGVATGLSKLLMKTGKGKVNGFHARLHATCAPGTGLSTSAAFSVLIGAAFNFLYLDGVVSPKQLALIAQRAENDFFGKPCGLMDQLACSVGQTVFIDFKNKEKPKIRKINKTLEGSGFQLAIVDTGGSHVELTDEYGSIPAEIKDAVEVLGKSFGREVSLELFHENIPLLRKKAGDRAVLRLLHFIHENKRAQLLLQNLESGNFSKYLQVVEESGLSSCMLLQNCATTTNSSQQGILLAQALSRQICPEAVCRVHGGGFAGTVQSYVPQTDFEHYQQQLERVFGTGSVIPLRLGRPGVCCLTERAILSPGTYNDK